MAGLVAANMLRRHEVQVLEKGPSLPHNHTAVLRFRSTAVSDATGIPFTHEIVRKGLWKQGCVINEPTIWDLNRYSLLVTGGHLADRSILNLDPAERWCAPIDFVEQMARNIEIKFNFSWEPSSIAQHGTDHPVISTVPMPFMMDMFSWRDKPKFTYLPVWTIRTTFEKPRSTVCQTLYRTDDDSWYRATIHGQQLTLEFMNDPHNMKNFSDTEWCMEAMRAFGSSGAWFFDKPKYNKLNIGKILPIEDKLRKRFLLWLTEKLGVYSLGRFATWRNILLDDIVKDVKIIESMIERQSTYDLRKNVH